MRSNKEVIRFISHLEFAIKEMNDSEAPEYKAHLSIMKAKLSLLKWFLSKN
jgi:hypothetical protein